jgi:undecaprenyl diphosphate synthase
VGGQTLVDFVMWCMEYDVKVLTVYAFSSENWNRDASEINALMTIFGKYAATLLKEAVSRNIRINILSTGYYHISYHNNNN